MVNRAKINDLRFWKKWKESGAIGGIENLITRQISKNAISMEPVKEKLRNLNEYIPNADDLLCGFGRYLASRLNPELVPAGFNLGYQLAIEDLRRGGDYGEYGKVDVPSHLLGYPSFLYNLLGIRISEVAKATCPQEFAEEVTKINEEIMKKIGESQ